MAVGVAAIGNASSGETRHAVSGRPTSDCLCQWPPDAGILCAKKSARKNWRASAKPAWRSTPPAEPVARRKSGPTGLIGLGARSKGHAQIRQNSSCKVKSWIVCNSATWPRGRTCEHRRGPRLTWPRLLRLRDWRSKRGRKAGLATGRSKGKASKKKSGTVCSAKKACAPGRAKRRDNRCPLNADAWWTRRVALSWGCYMLRCYLVPVSVKALFWGCHLFPVLRRRVVWRCLNCGTASVLCLLCSARAPAICAGYKTVARVDVCMRVCGSCVLGARRPTWQ
jgi:hypothetical protein